MKARLAFLDWARGLAAVIMLQGHVFHSFTRPELRGELPYVFSQFVGGMPPAIFLFLTGVTLAFLMESRQRQGEPVGRRMVAAWRRAGYLLVLAFAFRLQMWAFAWPHSPWTDLLRVDILNCMGVTLAVLAPMAALSPSGRAMAAAAAGFAIAAASPLVSHASWSGLPAPLRAYWVPDPQSFSLFPWAAFAAFGLSAGTLIRLGGPQAARRWAPHTAVTGLALIVGGRMLADLPFSPYPRSDFWLDSPLLVGIKLGVILLVLAGAYWWTEHRGARWSWVQQLGTTSLLVYWVHTELVYGRWLYFWKNALTLTQAACAAAAVIAAMLVLSILKTQWRQLRVWRLRSGSAPAMAIETLGRRAALEP
ncbi:MAG: heparan-alpha-glucosaminide N-acetyltransferase domain-containing protein [Bryobacterales bacterium]|nr:heparan-alpha-glucosaminide N-acetyltransferase domain-containing protein [Bryobacteraceae bacterium]MDW8355545.1 heparan-alpha-glucosaminide N-acetyltransferase domain-containing protein [Bryobacterales bacterium]